MALVVEMGELPRLRFLLLMIEAATAFELKLSGLSVSTIDLYALLETFLRPGWWHLLVRIVGLCVFSFPQFRVVQVGLFQHLLVIWPEN